MRAKRKAGSSAASISARTAGRQDISAPRCHEIRPGGALIEIPIVCVKNGDGPTVLFTGGVHGDEYEGQIAVSRLAQTLEASSVRGRVIMLPAVNVPAVLNDTRLSPIDQRDMNRCFPGNPRGTFSEMLAHFIDTVLLPLVDVSIDVHTAGHSMESALSTNMHYVADPTLRERTMKAASAFGAPYNVVFWGVDEGATLTSSVERRGILSVGTELGGWGRVHVEGVRIGRRGLDNILKHLGILEGEPDTSQRDGSAGDPPHDGARPGLLLVCSHGRSFRTPSSRWRRGREQ